MKKTMLKVLVLSSVEVLGLSLLTVTALSSCVGSGDGLEDGGDVNYWTSSRGQFTENVASSITNDDGSTTATTTTMYFIPNEDGTAAVTFNGAYPLHIMSKKPGSSVADTVTYVGDITIPSTVSHNGSSVPVTKIAQEAFCASLKMTSVTIPSTVTSIEEGAFTMCYRLKTINWPDPCNVTYIGKTAFGKCYLNVVNTTTTVAYGLTEVDIPASVQTIDENAFFNCANLVKLYLHKGLTTIGRQAFYIEASDFGTAASATEYVKRVFYIPSTVTHIGERMLGSTSTDGCKVRKINCYAVNPPTLDGELIVNLSDEQKALVEIHVPSGSATAYQQAANWNNYKIVDDLIVDEEH